MVTNSSPGVGIRLKHQIILNCFFFFASTFDIFGSNFLTQTTFNFVFLNWPSHMQTEQLSDFYWAAALDLIGWEAADDHVTPDDFPTYFTPYLR
jgi:hypothetical protein